MPQISLIRIREGLSHNRVLHRYLFLFKPSSHDFFIHERPTPFYMTLCHPSLPKTHQRNTQTSPLMASTPDNLARDILNIIYSLDHKYNPTKSSSSSNGQNARGPRKVSGNPASIARALRNLTRDLDKTWAAELLSECLEVPLTSRPDSIATEIRRLSLSLAQLDRIHSWSNPEDGSTCLHHLIAQSTRGPFWVEHIMALLQILLDGGSDINAMDLCGNTPLSLAVALGATSVAKALLDEGADPFISLDLLEADQDVVGKKSIAIYGLLFSPPEGRCAFEGAVMAKMGEVVEKMLEYHRPPNSPEGRRIAHLSIGVLKEHWGQLLDKVQKNLLDQLRLTLGT